LVLIPVPLSIRFLRREQRTLQSLMVLLVDTVAKEWGLIQVPDPVGAAAEPKPAEAAPADSPFKAPTERAPAAGAKGGLPKPSEQV